MRLDRRGLTVIELVLILVVIGLVIFFLFRLGGDDAPDLPPAVADTGGSAMVTPGAGNALATRLGVLAPLDSTAIPGDTLLVRVRATDEANTAIAGAQVAFEVTTGEGRVEPASTVTNDVGEVEARWILGPGTGAHTIRATIPGNASATVSTTVTAAAGAGAGAGTPQ